MDVASVGSSDSDSKIPIKPCFIEVPVFLGGRSGSSLLPVAGFLVS